MNRSTIISFVPLIITLLVGSVAANNAIARKAEEILRFSCTGSVWEKEPYRRTQGEGPIGYILPRYPATVRLDLEKRIATFRVDSEGGLIGCLQVFFLGRMIFR